jgi:hemin uptake protein HemP
MRIIIIRIDSRYRSRTMLELSPIETDVPSSRRDAVPQPASAHGRRIDSARLLGGGRELVIEHSGQEYRLRLTRNDKLILTK